MTEQEARLLLRLDEEDDFETARQQYRKLMMIYHPDTAGQDDAAALEMAKKLYEAYRLIKLDALTGSNGQSTEGRRRRTHTTMLRQNRGSFCARVLFVSNPLHDDMPPMRVAKGRFFWDPDVEDFRLFLRSVHMEAAAILEDLEHDCGFYSRADLPQPSLQDRCKRKLLHLLIQEWIDPVAALSQLCPQDSPKTGYHVEGTVAFTSGSRKPSAREMQLWEQLAPGDLLSWKLEDNRLFVQTEDGTGLGSLFFDEDWWYYIVIPLLLQETVSLRVSVKRKLAMQKLASGGAMLALDLHLTPTGAKYHIRTTAINEEIRSLLKKYERALKRPF